MKKCWIALGVSLCFSLIPLAAFAGVATFENGEGEPGDVVALNWSYSNTNNTQGIEFCVEWDDSVVNLSDSSQCLANLPAGFDSFSSCDLGAPQCPDGLLVGIAPNNLTDQVPSLDPAGSLSFSILPAVVPPASTALDLTCVDVTIGGVPADCNELTLAGGSIAVQAGPAALSFDPVSGSTINLGSVALGSTSGAETVEVCNTGGAGSEIDDLVATITAGEPPFAVDASDCDSALVGPDDCCNVSVTFEPTAVGGASGTLTIGTSVGDGSFTLTGTGTAGPAAALELTPAGFDFGGVDAGDSETETFTLTNSGPADSQALIGSISANTGEFSITGGTCEEGDTLGSGDDCTIEVEFAPSAAGEQSGSLTVGGTDTVNDTPLSASAELEGTGNGAIFASNPAPGNVNLGFAGAAGELDLDVSVTNSGNEDLTFVCRVGENQDDVFSFDPLDLTVGPDASEDFNVACDLPDLATYQATLICDTNDPENAEVEYTFTCAGLEPLPVPTMSNLSIALFAMLMLLVGGISIRFFRV